MEKKEQLTCYDCGHEEERICQVQETNDGLECPNCGTSMVAASEEK